MKEADNVLRILKEARIALEKNDGFTLNKLSDQTNNTASQTHDPDNIAVAVIVYALGKIISREHYRSERGWRKFYKNSLVYLDKAISSLEKNDEQGFRQALENIRKEIENLSGKLKKYISDVFEKARINKASKIYEHGISLEKTAKLLGVTLWELASYAGQKEHITDTKENKTISVKDRIKFVEEMFS
ncbi:hypothetical protein K9L16_02470 [Candidatus Pacearchaeota archaeon]|nr:hypothetical protein [Candidatus Pacearchaeota archaeon]